MAGNVTAAVVEANAVVCLAEAALAPRLVRAAGNQPWLDQGELLECLYVTQAQIAR